MNIEKGDKFRVNLDDRCGGYENGDIFVCEGTHVIGIEFYDNDGDLRSIGNKYATLVDDFGVPLGLKVEAGKFYKTRDGRKVGPMEPNGEDFGAGDGRLWRANGERWSKGHDEDRLVAEWVDNSVAGQSASDLVISIAVDTAALDAEIDRVKRKLKKLSKKARKLGLSLDYDLAA